MYYNFSDHTTDMNLEAVHLLNSFNRKYEVIAFHHLDHNSPRQIIGEKSFLCIFCKAGKPTAKFETKAHALPNFIGNNTLFTHRECDACNSRFGRLLESEFAGFMHLDHLVSGVKGKNGLLKFRHSDATIQTDGALIDWSNIPNEHLQYDKEAGTIRVKQIMPAFTPVAIYKCLVKMAIGLMPDSELSHFRETIEWICEDNHNLTKFRFEELWFLFGSASTLENYSGISALVLRRKIIDDNKIPYMIFRLTYANFVFHVPIPLSIFPDTGNWQDIPYMPTLCDLEFGFGKMNLQATNFAGTEKIKGTEKQFVIRDLDHSGTVSEAVADGKE